MEEDLSPKEQARIRARARKSRPPRMVVDNAGVKKIQQALSNRALKSRARKKDAR